MRRLVPTLVGASALTAVAIVGLVWLDYASMRRDLIGLLRRQALAVRHTVAAAARSNRAAAAVAEDQLAARLLDNARFLRELERRGTLTGSMIGDVAERSRLFRISVMSAAGERELGGSPGGAGHGPGHGFRGGVLAERLLRGEEAEVVTNVHSSRAGHGERLAAGVRREGGGAIVVTVDAGAVAELQRPASLHALLEDVTTSAGEIAFTVLDVGSLRLAHGDVPAEDSGTPDVVDVNAPPSERQLIVNGRPVMEFSGPVPLADGETARLRLGMRMDGVRAAEGRMLFRLAATLLAASLLVGLSLGTLWWSERYGALRARHARAEAALQRRDRLAAMGELAASVAHEVRNPLNAIAMSVKRVRREFLDETPQSAEDRAELSGLLGVMEAETRRIDQTVQQFLDFARPPRLDRHPTDLGELVSSLVASRRPLAEARGVAFDVDVGQAGEAMVDPDQIRQAADNVLRNALEATPAGGRVSVRACTGGGEGAIEVKDNGQGIEADKLGRIFDLYYTTKADGTGVGLAITQQIVSAHGGTVDVESSLGTGTRMTLRWPEAGGRHDA